MMKTQTQNPLLLQVELLSQQEAHVAQSTRWMDLPKFKSLTGGFEEIMHETASAFVEFMPGMLRDLKLAVEGRDADATGKILHKLKSSVSLLCSDAMSVEVIDLERMSSDVGNMDFISRVNKLILCITLLVTEVTQFIRS